MPKTLIADALVLTIEGAVGTLPHSDVAAAPKYATAGLSGHGTRSSASPPSPHASGATTPSAAAAATAASRSPQERRTRFTITREPEGTADHA
jgi:hypothetical protein